MVELSGRVALVTGGGRGIGRAIGEHLAQAGVAVALASRSERELAEAAESIRSAGGAVAAIVTDVADPAALDRLVAKTQRELGEIDILVNNAGVVGPLGPFGDVDIDEWAFATAVNLVAPARLTHACLGGMIRRRYGRIVNVSTGAVRSPDRGDTYNAYIATKMGLEGHSLNLAGELAGTGVTVNVLRPGIVDTAMQTYMRSQDPQRVGESFHRRFMERFEQGTLLSPDAPAKVVVELVSSERNGEVVSTPSPGEPTA